MGFEIRNVIVSILCTEAIRISRHLLYSLVETLRYKPEGRGFDSRWYHWDFFVGVDSAYNRNEYLEYFLGVKTAGR